MFVKLQQKQLNLKPAGRKFEMSTGKGLDPKRERI